LLVGVLDRPKATDRVRAAEVLTAGQDPVPGVHVGDAAVLGGDAADIDVASRERVDDDARLMTVLSLCQILMPGHCASRRMGPRVLRNGPRTRILYGAAGLPV
jgi:hypothetical protein